MVCLFVVSTNIDIIFHLPMNMGIQYLLPYGDRHKYDTQYHDGLEVYYSDWILSRKYDKQTESFLLEQQFRNHNILVHPQCKMKKEHGPN